MCVCVVVPTLVSAHPCWLSCGTENNKDMAHQQNTTRMRVQTLISAEPLTGRALALSLPTRNSHVLSMPRLMLMGLAPAVTFCRPKRMSSRASTEAVVVPSPALSLVRPATSLMSWAPAFSMGSSSSMARAMDTPSLMTWGSSACEVVFVRLVMKDAQQPVARRSSAQARRCGRAGRASRQQHRQPC